MARGARLWLATANPGKVVEIGEILGDAVSLVPRPEDLPETVEDAPTLEGNALLKARAVSSAVRGPALADDTGLEVDALDGAPGVRSARFAGEHATDAENVALLLRRLEGAPTRAARFRTVAALVDDDEVHAWDGVCEGTIASEPRGSGGFGYDPVFIPADGDGRTFAEMSAAEKHAISHRGRAFRSVAASLRAGQWGDSSAR